MSSLDRGPEAGDAAARVYDRAGVQEFLALAEAERARLETALGDAQLRRDVAERALADASEQSGRVGASFQSVARDLAGERDITERTIAVILAAAEAEAASLLAEARDEAELIRAVLPDERGPLIAAVESPVIDRSSHPAVASAPPVEERWSGPRLVG